MVNTQLAHSSQLVVNGLLTAASAAHFVKLSPEGAVRVAKLRTLSVLALVNILRQGWGWMDGRTVFARAAVVLGSVVLNLLGSIFVYWETHSCAMLHFLCATPGIAIVHAVLAMAFPLDLKGRLIHSPESDFNDLNLHWSLSLRAFINAGSMLAARITDSHAISMERKSANGNLPMERKSVYTHSIDTDVEMSVHMRIDMLMDEQSVSRHVCRHASRHEYRHAYQHVYRHAYRHADGQT